MTRLKVKLKEKGNTNQRGTIMSKTINELPSVLSVKDLAAFLGISRAGAYTLLHREDFPTLHINARLLVTKANLLAWMERNTNTIEA